MSRSLRFLLPFTAAAVLVASSAHAQPADHLQCYKIRDPNAFRGIVALNSPQFGPTGGCKIKIRGTKFCVPTRKTVVEIDPEVTRVEFASESLQFDRICYKVKCPSGPAPSPLVTDQFGSRIVETRGITEICTPAVKGPAPNPVCGNAVLEPGEECEDASDCGGGAGCSPSCTCQCLFADTQCPNVLEHTSLAGTGSETTSTEEDWGTFGFAHDMDVVDLSRLDLNISCAGSGPASCGECDVRGVNPAPGNCRCENDNRALCDQPFVNDGDDCAGDACLCYAAPPTPRSHGNVPICVIPRLTDDPEGTWNVDTGVGNIDVSLARLVYLGDSLVEPCPTCDGDVTPGDGIRDGTCTRGDNDGESCDANGSDATFPAPGGGDYSYDCFPDAGKNVAGNGLQVSDLSLSTGASSLTATVPCGIPSLLIATCHCGVCSGDNAMPCSSDGECLAVGAGSCVAQDNNELPNGCDGLVCSPAGGGEGVCATGPTDQLCDGVLRANGEGIVACQTNADCDPINLGFDAGDCTLTKQRECFLPTIDAQGSPSTSQPTVAGIACTARTANAGTNLTVGLPGPLRLNLEGETVFRCASDPSFTYPSCP